MTSCGHCGHELPSTDGRFCGRCGHEAIRGNARYPLYADGSAAVTRQRPRLPIALFDTGAGLLREAPDSGVHRRRDGGLEAGLGGVLPSARWGTAVLTTLAVMLVVAVLGAWLMLH